MPPSPRHRRRPRAVTAVAAALLVLGAGALAGCSDDEPDDGGTTAPSRVDVGGNAGRAPEGEYVALGDSYTAAPYVPTTNPNDGCLRSDGNYPSLLARELPRLSLTDVSCGGASTQNMDSPQTTSSGQQPPQLDALTDDTSLVTLGIGGNDYSTFGTLITSCLQIAPSDPTGAPCQEAADDDGGESLDEVGAKIRANIETVVADVAERSPDARVLLVGYPEVVPAEGTCDQLPLAAGDYAFARDVLDMLNGAVAGAARSTGAEFVDVREATEGHDICATDPWIAGIQPVGGAAAPFHPYAAEQQAVADLLADTLRQG